MNEKLSQLFINGDLASCWFFVYHTGMTTYQSAKAVNPAWYPIRKPAEIAEKRLIEAILENVFPINSQLPGERELAETLGVTRPTLREALQRLARDGWIEIHQGKSTRVRDYWKEGKLGVLNSISANPHYLPENFVDNLLHVRQAMAPAYTAQAVANGPQAVYELLDHQLHFESSPTHFSEFDWQLQYQLSILGGNPVFTMILNGFQDLYLNFAPLYFALPAARQASLDYYYQLGAAALQQDADQAKNLTAEIMQMSLVFWEQTKYL